MRRLNRWKVGSIIKNTNGKIFSAKFVKKNGDIRDITCRLETETGKKGTGVSPEKLDNPYICVYDMQKEGYRMINLETLMSINMKGVEYNVKD